MKKLSLLVFLVLACYSYAQTTDESIMVGSAGNKKITKRDLQERYEFTPTLYSQNKGTIESARLNFLHGLIAEKLWSLEAEERHLDTSRAITTASHQFESMFIRDKLYMDEIRGKAVYTDAEFREAVRRQATKFYVRYLFADDSTEIFALYDLLNKGANFDTMVSTREEFALQTEPQEVKYGQMAADIEDELYTLAATERYTKPMFTPAGWYIFYIENLKQEIKINPGNPDSPTTQQAEKVLKTRKENDRYKDFIYKFFINKKADVNAVLLRSLAVHLSKSLSDKKKRFGVSDTAIVNWEPQDVAAILDEISNDSLRKPFVTTDNFTNSYYDFILALAFDGFKTTETGLQNIFKNLQARARKYLEGEFLAWEGRKMNLDKDPEVIRQVSMWKDNYLYQMLRRIYADSVKVSDAEAMALYKKYNKDYIYPRAVNIIEILTDSLETVETILNRVKKGEDFRTLAHIYNKRASTMKKDGEYGMFPVDRFGEIGRVAWDMKVGDVYGPIKLAEGYSIIKLLEKREEYTEKPKKTFAESKERLLSEIISNRTKRKFDQHTAALAMKYGIKVDYPAFQTVETTTIPSFAIRRLGFGGQMTAAPLFAPDFDWIYEYSKMINQNP